MPTPEALLEHAGFIRALARTLVRDEHVADDIVQQTYLAALENPPGHAANLRAWLGKVARNFAFRAHRTEKRRAVREEMAEPRRDAPAPEEVAARLELQRQVVDAVMALEEPYRSTVVLRYFDDCSPEEIARRMDVPRETVRTRLRRAVERMRGRLDLAHGGNRRAWVVALLPLAGTREALAAKAAGTAAITGGLVMSAKVTWSVAAVLVFATVFFIWEQSGDSTPFTRTGERGAVDGAALADAGSAAEETPSESAESEAAPRPDRFTMRAVVRDGDGAPVPEARITLQKSDFYTDAEGEAQLLGHGASTMTVEVRAKGYVPWNRGIDPLRVTRLDVTLQRGAPVSAVVLAPDRSPLEGVEVAAWTRYEEGLAGMWQSTQENVLGSGRTDEAGRAEIGAAPAGKVLLKIDDPRYAPVYELFAIAGLDPVEVEIVLNAGGAITGRVVDSGDRPVAGARVFLDRMQSRFTKTGADGRYRLERVGSDPQVVGASSPEHGTGYFGDLVGWDERVELHVRPGQTLTGIDIRLPEALFLTGRVVDADKKPIEDVTVGAWVSTPPNRHRQAKTDARGRFRVGPFTYREKSIYSAWFGKPGYVFPYRSANVTGREIDLGEIAPKGGGLPVAGRVVDPDGKPVERGRVRLAAPGLEYSVAIGPGGTFGFERGKEGECWLEAECTGMRSHFTRVEVGAQDIELTVLPVKTIRGRVVTPQGKPRVGVNVFPLRGEAPRWLEGASSDEEGRFVLTGLVEGEYKLTAGKHSVMANAGDQHVEFVVPLNGAVLTGRVASAATGLPVRSYQLRFVRYRFFVPSNVEVSASKSDDGLFRYELDEAGTWAVEIAAPGFALQRTKPLALKAGSTTDLGTLRLGAGGVLAGVVRDEQGRPVPHARIHFLNASMNTNEHAPFTDQDGRYEIRAVAAGAYNVFAVSPRHPMGVARAVKVAEGKTTRVDFDLPPASPLTLIVQDENGQPIEGADLAYSFPAVRPLTSKLFRGYEPPGWGPHKTDANGTLVKTALPAAEVTLIVAADGYESQTRVLTLRAGEPNRLEVRLKRK